MAVVRRMVFALTVVTIVTMVVAFSPPSAAVTTSKIGPRQHYVGLVNAKRSGAVIHVACPGPSGRTGAPTGGQTVNVKRVSSGGGYTGSAAHEIWAQFGRDARHVVGFTSYNTPKAIPASLRLPCRGTGTVTFTTCFGTMPCAANAKAYVVKVKFVNVAV